VPELTNDFSWSRSRDGVFSECKRRYYYHYYGSWGGWDASAAEEVRRLYVLKQLASRQMWAGRVVHDAIEMALHVFAAGREAEVWQMLRSGVERSLRNFFRLSLLAEIRKTPPEHWSIEHWSKVLDFEGTPMWIAPDFGFWTLQGRLALVDWKTGGSDPDSAAFQLGCYALYAKDMLGVDPDNVDLLEVNLREPAVTPHKWDTGRLGDIREQLRLSIRGMKAYLADPEQNVAVIDAFERTEQLRICRWCNFRAVCRPEL
jgi:hypothetical protein